MPEACSACNPAVNKPRLYILSFDINYTDNVLNIKFNAVLEYKQAGCPLWDYVITQQCKQSFGFELFHNFEIIAHFKNQSRYASGFYDVKGTGELFVLKSTSHL